MGSSGLAGDLWKIVQINEGQLKAGLSELARAVVRFASSRLELTDVDQVAGADGAHLRGHNACHSYRAS